MDNNFQRVKILCCHGDRIVQVWRYKPGEKPHKDFQVFEEIIGIAIPMPHKRPGVIVIPLEYYNRGTWTKYAPGYCYFRVKEEDLQPLGKAFVQEMALVTMSLRKMGLPEIGTPLQRVLKRIRRSRKLHGLEGDFR